jgi:ElaB/YqjD/DUF883 family membrane-anchored ribosome-binding protein
MTNGRHEGAARNAGRSSPPDAQSLRDAVREAATRAAGNPEVEQLIADVEALIDRLGDPKDPATAQLCTRVAEAVARARAAVSERAAQVQRQTRDALQAGDAYVRTQPWESVGVAAVAGLVVGMLLFRR